MPAGFLLDAYSDPQRREMVVWVRSRSGSAHRLAEPFVPEIFVKTHGGDLDDLARALAVVRGVGEPTLEERLCALEAEPSKVLRVPVPDETLLLKVAQMIDLRGDYKDFELFDVDLRMSHRYLLAKGLFPLAWVRAWGAGRFDLHDEQWATDYEPPPLTRLEVEIEPDVEPGAIPTPETPLRAARAGDERYEGREEDALRWLHRAVARADPDVVLTRGGDSFGLPYLRERAARYGGLEFHLGREPDPAGPRRRGKSFWTYGKIKYQAPVHALHGRLHLDTSSSFFYSEAGLQGLVDLSRVSDVPLQDMARLGAGTAITAIQIDLAKREGRLVPWKKNWPERFKTGRDLLLADRGGYIFEPRVGLHEDVVELDFASLYPNLMVHRNISAEAMLCACCRPEDLPLHRVVPQLGTWTCGKRVGFIPRALEPVVRRREHWKRMRKRDPANRARYQECSDTLKWLLVCSFGYQGYKNAKFGRIECHEAICAWGRETLLAASEVARDHGFEFVHGIVDSLWVRRVLPGSDPHGLSRAVEREIGIPFEHQGRYKWIVFLPTRSWSAREGVPDVGALNRYYGCFDAPPDKPSRSQAGQPLDYLARGALKVRGVELRQHSTPGLLREAQERILVVLAQADDAAGFHARIPAALDHVRPLLERVRSGDVPLEDLVFTNVVSQDLEQYKANTHAHAALKLLARRGVRVPPGDAVRYVVLDAQAREPRERVVEARLVKGGEAYDRAFYEAQTLRAVSSLLLPFGWTEERLAERFHARPQRTLAAWA